jgi:hypothetical protein
MAMGPPNTPDHSYPVSFFRALRRLRSLRSLRLWGGIKAGYLKYFGGLTQLTALDMGLPEAWDAESFEVADVGPPASGQLYEPAGAAVAAPAAAAGVGGVNSSSSSTTTHAGSPTATGGEAEPAWPVTQGFVALASLTGLTRLCLHGMFLEAEDGQPDVEAPRRLVGDWQLLVKYALG